MLDREKLSRMNVQDVEGTGFVLVHESHPVVALLECGGDPDARVEEEWMSIERGTFAACLDELCGGDTTGDLLF